jgi:hypothetical protein
VESNPDIQFHFIGNQAPNFEDYWGPIMKDLPSNVKVWGDINSVPPLPNCLENKPTFECHPTVSQVTDTINNILLLDNKKTFNDYIEYIKLDGNKIATSVIQAKSGHQIVMNDKDNTVTISNASGVHIVLTKDKVNIVGAGQKAVQGDNLETWLGQLIDILKTGTTATGIPFNPALVTALEVLRPQIKQFLSDKVTLE